MFYNCFFLQYDHKRIRGNKHFGGIKQKHSDCNAVDVDVVAAALVVSFGVVMLLLLLMMIHMDDKCGCCSY